MGHIAAIASTNAGLYGVDDEVIMGDRKRKGKAVDLRPVSGLDSVSLRASKSSTAETKSMEIQ